MKLQFSLLRFLIVAFYGIITSCGTNVPKRLPEVKVLLLDSSTIINTKSVKAGCPIVLMYFSPDCEHCHAETQEILKNMGSLRDVQFFMVTPKSLAMLKPFYNGYKLGNYKNIKVGKDYQYGFYSNFKPRAIPYIVLYDENRKLVKVFDGTIEAKDLIAAINKYRRL